MRLSWRIKCFIVTECRHNWQLSKLSFMKTKKVKMNQNNSFKQIDNDDK